MPSRNILRIDLADSYYHIYGRGGSKQPIFCEPADYYYFIDLFRRYLSLKQQKDPDGMAYPHFRGEVELLAYCLMSNHFHLFLYQIEQGTVSRFMKSLLTSYTHYFNQKYHRSGPLLESRYKASRISNDAYLIHISRYIHLNPRSWRLYPYSSIKDYRGKSKSEWLQAERVFALFDQSFGGYTNFLADYEIHRDMLATLKHELADT